MDKELEKRIEKAIEFIKDNNVVVAISMDGSLYSSKDFLIDILEGKNE